MVLDLSKIITALPVVVTVLSVFVEISPVKINPLTMLFSWIGKIMLKDLEGMVLENSDAISKNSEAITNLEKTTNERFDAHIKSEDEKEAKRLRANIIAFADSCRVGNKHTENHFENVFREISEYYNYCVKHDIKNHFIDEEHVYIREVFRKCKQDNNFLI